MEKFCALLSLLLLAACQISKVECNPECRENWMDGPRMNDSDGIAGRFLVSKRFPLPDRATLAKPVIIAVHGFTASTFEWREFREWAEDSSASDGGPGILVSPVLLGGHGRDLADFQAASWEDWGRPILAEYDSLIAKGYRNVSFAGASTGATLLLRRLSDGAFASRPAPKWFFFADPLVVAASKLLPLVEWIGPLVGNSPNPGTPDENRNWYVNRPAETLRQLYILARSVKRDLETGISLPPGSRAKTFKSEIDRTVNPASADYIAKGLRDALGAPAEVEMLPSSLHVITRLRARDPSSVTRADTLLQLRIFGEMRDKVRGD